MGGASHATSILAVNGESSGRAQLDAAGALSPHRPTEHVRLHGGTVTIIRLAHYAIHTSDLEASRRFYTEVMGFRVGYRPSFPFPGIWLYQHEEQSEFGIVHIIGLDPDDPKNLEGYWGIGSNKPRSGTDSFDHIAFLAKDWPQMRTRCQAHRVDYVERSVPELGLHQVFLVDPSGITLELNYPAIEGSAE